MKAKYSWKQARYLELEEIHRLADFLRLDDVEYRTMLFKQAGCWTAKELDVYQRKTVINHLRVLYEQRENQVCSGNGCQDKS